MFSSNFSINHSRSYGRYINYKYIKRFCSCAMKNSEILRDSFGLSSEKAMSLVYKLKLQNRNTDLLSDTINYCKRIGFTDDEILNTPRILKNHALKLEQHNLVMEEGGFQNISSFMLSNSRFYMNQEIKALKSKGHIPESLNVTESFLNYIEKPFPEEFHVEKCHDFDIWSLVHLDIIKKFLKHRLKATDDEIVNLFRIHKMIQGKSLRVLQENIKLAQELGFTEEKILRYGYLLHNYPGYPKTVLKEFPDLAGANMRVAMRQYPKLIMTNPRNIVKIYGILKEFDIPDENIRKSMNIFHLSPETVRMRLTEVERIPELNILFHHPKLLKLVVHHNRTKSRLSFLQQLQLKCASFIVLDSYSGFDDHIKEGKDVNKNKDVLIFLENLFGKDSNTFRERWKKHPFHLQVPLLDMEMTFHKLRSLRFRKAEIFEVMHLILYPADEVENSYYKVKSDKTLPNLTKIQSLNLMLYYLEKEYHFTGNGIWKNRIPPAHIAGDENKAPD